MKKQNAKQASTKKYRISDIITIVLFLAVIFGFAAGFVLTPDQESSSFETGLQTLPNINKGTAGYKGADYVLHGKLADQADEYFCDQFPFRKQFVTLKSWIETMTLRGISNGVFNGGTYLATVRFNAVGVGDNTELYSKEHVQASFENLKDICNAATVPVDIMLPPRTIDVVGESIDYPCTSGEEIVKQAQDILGDSYVDMLSVQRDVYNQGYIPYYRTDHHWTTVGAFYAYEVLAARWGERPPQLDFFDCNIPVKTGFLGTAARNGNYFNHPGDDIYLPEYDGDENFVVEVGASFDRMVQKDGMFDYAALDSRDPYNVFMHGKTRYARITDPNKERQTVLVIKDSFAHTLVPYIAKDYNVVMIDIDTVNNIDISDWVEKTGADRVLVLYNLQNVIETERLKALTW